MTSTTENNIAIASSAVDDLTQDPFLRPLVDLGLAPKLVTRHQKLPRASILVLLFRFQGEWQVLLTQRPLTLKSHAGEVCCPGGKQDPEDQGDDVETALRETHEEVGIDRSEIVPIASTQTIESVGGLCVTPIVALWKNPVLPSALTINKEEVEAAFYVPLSYFWNEVNCDEKRDLEWRGATFTMRTYYYKDILECKPNDTPEVFKIWGLTAAVVHEVAALVQPKPTTALEGTLYRWMDQSRGKPYWAQRYFVLGDNDKNGARVLHQYDTERKAKAKADTATKKNRLLLNPEDCQVLSQGEEAGKYIFTVSILEGRVQWKVSATSSEERNRWLAAIAATGDEKPNKKLKSEESPNNNR